MNHSANSCETLQFKLEDSQSHEKGINLNNNYNHELKFEGKLIFSYDNFYMLMTYV